jgi:hypothetical protein
MQPTPPERALFKKDYLIVKTNQVVSTNPDYATGDRKLVQLAKIFMVAKGSTEAAVQIAKARSASRDVVELLEKEAVAPGYMSDPSNWASPLVQPISAGFLGSTALRHRSVVDTAQSWQGFIPGLLNMRFHVTTVGAQGAAVAEGSTKPISKIELATGVLEPIKVSCTVVVTDEVARALHPAANELIQNELAGGIGTATDEVFLSTIADAASPTTTSGDTAANTLTDLSAALASIAGSSGSHYVAVISPATAKVWAFFDKPPFQFMTALGGSVRGLPILISDSLPTGVKLIVFDAAQIVCAPGTVVLDGSQHATLALSDESTDGQTLTSLWQRGLRAVRCERVFGFELLRSSGVAVVEDASA